MIKYADIFIYAKKLTFASSVNLVNGFDNDKDLEDEIDFQINQLIENISKCKHLPKFIIKKLIDKKIYSLYVYKYTLYDLNKFSEEIFTKQYERFKSEPFCNNEYLASYIVESSSNKAPSQRNLVFGNDSYWSISIRRELLDYDLNRKFYKIGDIVLIKNFKEPFVITWYDKNTEKYNFCNLYDVFCIKNNEIQFTCDDGVHYNQITKVIGHDLDLAKRTILANKSEYTPEYIEEVMNMTE